LGVASTSSVGSNVVVTWPYTTDEGGVMVSKYRIKFKTSTGTYQETLTYCDGSDPFVIADMSCTVPMSIFTTSPFSLSVGDLIEVVVEAYNSVGYSTPSPVNTVGATAKTPPQVSVSNLARGASTTKTQIQLTWTGISSSPQNGGDYVDYKIYWNQGALVNSWALLTSTTNSATSYTTSTSIITGHQYQFMVEAFNTFGSSPNSTVAIVYAAISPSGLSAPTTL